MPRKRVKTLLIVDLQNDFLPGGSLAVAEAGHVIPIINSLMDKFDLILATKDWHPENHISFASRHGKKPGDLIILEGREQELWPIHCVQNTSGAAFSPLLHADKIDEVFLKGTNPDVDSYSCFFDNARAHSTGLASYLKERGIEEIYIAGLTTEYCVKFTVLDALSLGFKPYVLLDACRGVDLQAGNVVRAVEEMKAAGAIITSSSAC